jgi:hypothetical protein
MNTLSTFETLRAALAEYTARMLASAQDNTLETLRADLAQLTERVLAFAQVNPRITALCSLEMMLMAMELSIHEHEIFHITCLNDSTANYCLFRLAQHLGVREGTLDQYKFAFLDEEEPSDELVALADQFLVNVIPDCVFPATYWDEQICDVVSMNAEMDDPEEFEDESEHAIAAPSTPQAPVK